MAASLCLIFCVAIHANVSPDADWLLHGKQLLTAGKSQEAANWFHRSKENHSNDSRAYFYVGVALTNLGDFTGAAAELNEALRLEPNRPEYQLYLANALIRLSRKNQARETLSVFRNRATINQLPANRLQLLGDVYYRLEMNDEALHVLSLLSKRQPANDRVDLNLGQVYVSKRQYDLALRHLESSIRKKPDQNPQAYFELGRILHQQNQLGDAKAALLKAVSQEPGNSDYLHRLGVVCLDLDQADEALVFLKRAEPDASVFPKILSALARTYRAKGDSAKAVDYGQRFEALVLTKKHQEEKELRSEQLLERGEKKLDEGHKEEARRLFENAVEINSQSWDAHGYLAEMLMDSDDWRKSYPHLVKMEEIDPNSPVGNYLMASYHHLNKNPEQARNYAERVKVTRPGNADLRNLLGNIYTSLGQSNKALVEYEAAVQLAPKRADYRSNLETARQASGMQRVPTRK